MKAIVTYESLYGNTAAIARAVAEGLAGLGSVVVMPASDDVRRELVDADLLVVGGPTHIHGMSTTMSRRAAVDGAAKEGEELQLEGEAIRTLLERLGEARGLAAAAFDTRAHGPKVLTGSAAKGIAGRLRHHGLELVVEPESFVVTASEGPLTEGEAERARVWGALLAETPAARAAAAPA